MDMDIAGAVLTADVAAATYDDRKHQFEHWIPEDLDEVSDGWTHSFVASDERFTMLAFRGTQNRLSPLENFVETTKQWFTNINYAQRHRDGFRLHRGFDTQLDGVYSDVIRVAKKHGAHKRPFILTGHSAGGALATIAAQRLSRDGVQPDAVYVFASPRVGDRKFCQALEKQSISLYRFEQRDDLITHFPLSPVLAKWVGNLGFNKFMQSKFVEEMNEIFPGLDHPKAFTSDQVEYLHAGKLFYRDWEDTLLCSADVGPAFEADDVAGFFERLRTIFGSDEEGTEVFKRVPKQILDVVRVVSTINNVIDQIDDWSDKFGRASEALKALRFLIDHNLLDLKEFLLGLAMGR